MVTLLSPLSTALAAFSALLRDRFVKFTTDVVADHLHGINATTKQTHTNQLIKNGTL
jgi:hypothetical protein